MSKRPASFRVGRVKAYLRGRIWYLCYYEHGVRRRPRVGPDKDAARLLAAQTNAQLESGAPPVLSFEAVSLPKLRDLWLSHHEHVLRSSLQSIRRYRSATQHLDDFVTRVQPVRDASRFGVREAEGFVRYLRTLRVSPNGHPRSARRPLYDKGIRFILEACRAMFNYAARRRHLSPYAPNPFSELQLDRLPMEHGRAVSIFSEAQERAFLESCDEWQFPLFLTLIMTGMRPGEASHLLFPEDVDFAGRLLTIRNRPNLGWRVKTGNERTIPLVDELVPVLQRSLGPRKTGPLFRRRRFETVASIECQEYSLAAMENELKNRVLELEGTGQQLRREEIQAISERIWRKIGILKNEQIRREYLRVCRQAGIAESTSPKSLRHLFATRLQTANTDPLIRMELMGHSLRNDGSVPGLGMTARYTHTRPEVRFGQLQLALEGSPAMDVVRNRLKGELLQGTGHNSCQRR